MSEDKSSKNGVPKNTQNAGRLNSKSNNLAKSNGTKTLAMMATTYSSNGATDKVKNSTQLAKAMAKGVNLWRRITNEAKN